MVKGVEKKPKNLPVEEDSDEEIPDLEEAFELPHPVELPDEESLEVALLQREFEAAELDQLRASVPIFRSLYERRNTLIESKLKQHDFWSRVFCSAPKDILDAFTTNDVHIVSSLLRSFHVERMSVDEKGQSGDPRDLKFVFEFARGGEDVKDDNIWFAGEGETLRLEKKFYWRKQITKVHGHHRQMWEGLVSEPVRIPWKEGADPTKGLLDAACDLFEAEKKTVAKTGKRITGAERTSLPEYEKLVTELEKVKSEISDAEEGEGDDDSTEQVKLSFFNWFGYRGRDITAEESAAAMKEDGERWAKLAKGEDADDEECTGHDDDEDDDEEDDGSEGMDDAEVYTDGEELAFALADELWPKALPYFNESFEEDEDDDDDEDIDEAGLSEFLKKFGSGEGADDDDDEEFDGIEEVEEQPPKKKARKTA